MNHIIKNYNDLNHTQEREDMLAVIESAYHAIDTEQALKDRVRIENETLHVNNQLYNLADYSNIYVIGFGKVAAKAAYTLDEIFGNRISDGAVAGIASFATKNVTTYVCSHPRPSAINVEAAHEIESIAQKVTADDLVLVIVGGGGSSLLCSHEQERIQGEKLYNEFLNTGGTIEEMNIVRKHISAFKGGGLAKLLYPAQVINLIFSDVPGDDLETIASGPTMYDASTKEDAQAILDKYNLSGYELNETPKDKSLFAHVDNHLMVSNNTALLKMKEVGESLGYSVIIAGNDLFLSASETIEVLQSKAQKNTLIIAGGETRYVIPEGCEGKGGRSDMLALSMLEHLHDNQVFAAFASDGHDNTEAAGGLVDMEDQKKIQGINMDVADKMVCLDSFPVMEALGALIFTGKIESNISDLMILLTPGDK
jgi:glycerate-2-kinase